jgi:ArsR family transcriptional regulator
MKGKSDLAEMENLYTALSDQTRLRLLNLMREDEVCVCFFTEALGESQPKISRHLAYLRKAGLVRARREGKWMHYQIDFPENRFAREVLENTLEWLGSQEGMREEYENLVSACCSLNVPVTIARAPKPETIVESNTPPPREKDELETFLL